MRADALNLSPSEEWMQFDLHHVAQEWNEAEKKAQPSSDGDRCQADSSCLLIGNVDA